MPKILEDEVVSMGIRITRAQRAELEAIAARQCNTVGGVIRLAVNNMIADERAAVRAIKKTNRRLKAEAA